MKQRLILSLVLSFGLVCAALAQVRVQGTVTQKSDGQPVIGASVVSASDSKVGTVSDMDGHFTLDVPEGTMLKISYIGCKDVRVKAAATVAVALEDDSQMMDELVVTGYQTQRKVDLTGAVGVMNMKQPKSEGSANILTSMQGRIAGVQIVNDNTPGGGGSTIRVRGMSTINGNNPLYVIDGVATNENLNSINPADIETIQVLKDASSASIYGSRAANGVVVITTKKGKGDRLSVNVGITGSMQDIAKTHDMLNAQQWGQAYWQANRNSGLTPSHPFYTENADGQPVLKEFLDADGLVRAANHNWQDDVYHKAWTENINASVSNSTERSTMLFSGNYINQDGLMRDTYYRRFTVRLNSTYKISNYINVGENFTFAKWNSRGASTGDDRAVPYTAMRQHPAIPVYDAGGAFANPLALCGSDIQNPMQMLYNQRDDSNDSQRLFGNAYIEVLPLKGLALKSNFGYEHVQYLSKTLGRKFQPTDATSVSRGYGQGDTWTWTNTANYNVALGKHNLTALGGLEAIGYTFEDLTASRMGYAFEDEAYMQLNSGSGEKANGGGKQEWALFSAFAKLDWNYADRYLLSATLRSDATSRLAKANRSDVFVAFSGAWRFTEENFFPKNDVLTSGKLRVAWGQNGNAAISNNYASYSTFAYDAGNGAYDINGTNNQTQSGIITATTGNTDLKWETTTQTNIGLDLGFWNGRLNLSADYYIKKTKDMLTQPEPLMVEGQNATTWQNTGEMKNTGFEITADYHSPAYGDFSWDGTLNLSRYKNEVVRLNARASTMGGDVRLIEGQPMGVYYGYINDGIFQNADEVSAHAQQQGKGVGRLRFRDIDGNGIVNEADRCIIGDPNPDFSLGLTLDLHYKALTLSTFFTGDFGFDALNLTKKQLDFMSYGIPSTNRGTSLLDAWTPQHTNTSVPALSVTDNNDEQRMSTYFVEDGSYFKMKYIKLSYDLPKRWASALFANSINVFAQVENVFTITDYTGLDPELPLGNWGQREDQGPYPSARTFTLGFNMQF